MKDKVEKPKCCEHCQQIHNPLMRETYPLNYYVSPMEENGHQPYIVYYKDKYFHMIPVVMPVRNRLWERVRWLFLGR